jgi:hypothetical protein
MDEVWKKADEYVLEDLNEKGLALFQSFCKRYTLSERSFLETRFLSCSLTLDLLREHLEHTLLFQPVLAGRKSGGIVDKIPVLTFELDQERQQIKVTAMNNKNLKFVKIDECMGFLPFRLSKVFALPDDYEIQGMMVWLKFSRDGEIYQLSLNLGD